MKMVSWGIKANSFLYVSYCDNIIKYFQPWAKMIVRLNWIQMYTIKWGCVISFVCKWNRYGPFSKPTKLSYVDLVPTVVSLLDKNTCLSNPILKITIVRRELEALRRRVGYE